MPTIRNRACIDTIACRTGLTLCDFFARKLGSPFGRNCTSSPLRRCSKGSNDAVGVCERVDAIQATGSKRPAVSDEQRALQGLNMSDQSPFPPGAARPESTNSANICHRTDTTAHQSVSAKYIVAKHLAHRPPGTSCRGQEGCAEKDNAPAASREPNAGTGVVTHCWSVRGPARAL